MKLLINLLISALAIYITAWLLPGVLLSGFGAAVVVAVVLGLINAVLKPVLVILTLPITIVTLGIFYFILNALLVMLAGRAVSGFEVVSLGWALGFSLVQSVVQMMLNGLVKD